MQNLNGRRHKTGYIIQTLQNLNPIPSSSNFLDATPDYA